MDNTLLTSIISYLRFHPGSSRKDIGAGTGSVVSDATLKRAIAEGIARGYIAPTGKGRATVYSIKPQALVGMTYDLDDYFSKEVDDREIQPGYNFDLITDILPQVEIFSDEEMAELESLQAKFRSNVSQLSQVEYDKEMERLGIDLSWKSSQIEGNTYSLLETERLLKELQQAAGKTQAEARMLLNHKEALKFILQEKDYLNPLSIHRIEDIHSILVQNLGVARNIRTRRVGITGTNYRPLDNEFQIREALDEACNLINSKTSVFEKALLTLVLISYIQPFEDGNKRTARITSNAILIANDYCPISFRTVDSIDYKKAMLLFYEQNNISAFKKIFIDQFRFAVEQYF